MKSTYFIAVVLEFAVNAKDVSAENSVNLERTSFQIRSKWKPRQMCDLV